jgi:hypothetical protein
MFINYFVHKDECYVIYVSGNVFDCLSEDKSISSNEIIDNFCKDYESIHKVHLPIPNGPTNYRQLFLRAGGYDSEENLQKLRYPRCVTSHLEGGSMDLSKFVFGNDYVSRRFPTIIIHVPNIKKSNAPEFRLGLKEKFELLLKKLKKNEFLISAKSNLNERRINYVFYESIVDVTEHPNSHEYKNMRLLLACTSAIKQKELNKMVSSPIDHEEVEDSVPLVTIKRNSEESPMQMETNVNETFKEVEENSASKRHKESVSPVQKESISPLQMEITNENDDQIVETSQGVKQTSNSKRKK